MPAIKNNLIPRDPFYGLRISMKNVNRGFLSMDDIRKIEAVSELSKGVEQARDIFLFACYTGMAYIDIKQFKPEHLIKEVDGTVFIHKHRQKTDQLCIIPLLAPAERILLKYAVSDNIRDFKWRVASNQTINDHLKNIAKTAGLNRDLFFHLARHTFATTVTLSNGVPIETVSKMLGHASIAMTQRYAKVSGYKIKDDTRILRGLFKCKTF
jgi:site-specific recombinase XerD